MTDALDHSRDNDPVTLADAAQHFNLRKGVLMAEGKRGRLEIFLLGKAYYTTPNAIREWVAKCRVQPKVHGSISTRKDARGPSGTAQISSARDALRRTLNAPNGSSRNT